MARSPLGSGVKPGLRSRGRILSIALALILSGCGSTQGSGPSNPPTTARPATQHFASDLVAFDFPVGWVTRAGAINPSGNWTIVFVGSHAPPSECVESTNGGECYVWPIMRLVPGEVMVAARDHGMPNSVPPSGGDPTTIGGRPSRVTQGPADAVCLAIGGDESIGVVTEPTSGRAGWFAIDACLAGPDHRSGEATFAAMLASVAFR